MLSALFSCFLFLFSLTLCDSLNFPKYFIHGICSFVNIAVDNEPNREYNNCVSRC